MMRRILTILILALAGCQAMPKTDAKITAALAAADASSKVEQLVEKTGRDVVQLTNDSAVMKAAIHTLGIQDIVGKVLNTVVVIAVVFVFGYHGWNWKRKRRAIA